MKLFKSHKSNFKNGEQARDFVYIKDVTSILIFFFKNKNNSGIYNLGTGIARTFYDLVISTFDSMNIKSSISYIETPIDIRSNYQYFTQANISKLKSDNNRIIGYGAPAKATTALNFFGISDEIEFIIEDNKLKHGKFLPAKTLPGA